MCGIAAIMGVHMDGGDRTIRAMVAKLRHRGPDGDGVTLLEGCHLGHARLSIVDLAGGAQPMPSADSRYWISFNGEIYNFADLRAQLEGHGWTFRSKSDTEVVLASFAQWGEQCVDRFRGMFAFAIWDTERRRLFCARDLFGEKPLYFARRQGGLAVASEIPALRAAGGIPGDLCGEGVDAYLALGYLPPDLTIYQAVQTLPPGHYLTWDADTGVAVRPYWKAVPDPRPIDMAEAAGRLRELLQVAVRRQMVADVPLGAFLSGGLDSSTIVALMQQSSTQPVKTFSVAFGDEIDERPFARAVAAMYGTDHHELDVGPLPVGDLVVQMADIYDEPFADTSHIPTFLVSKFARTKVTVCLSGDGGDELFGGYSWYPTLAAAEGKSASRLHWLVARGLSTALGHRWHGLDRQSQILGVASRWPKEPWRRAAKVHTYTPDATRQAWRASQAGWQPTPPVPPRGDFEDVLAYDAGVYLPGDILVKVDRAAMANSLETRAPFLDRDVAEFCLSLPYTLKLREGETKAVLRAACRELWPQSLHQRGKQGFGAPYPTWLRRPDVEEHLRRVLAPGSDLRNLLPGLEPRWPLPATYQTWMLLTLGLWLERRERAPTR